MSCPLPSGRGFVALLEAFRASGGAAPGQVVDRLLEKHRVGHTVSLARLIAADQVFGFEWRESLWIPMFQFDSDDLSLKATVQRIRAELPALASGWALASWFAGPSARLDGRRPVDMVETHLDAVLRAARAWVPTDAAETAVEAVPDRWAKEVAAHA